LGLIAIRFLDKHIKEETAKNAVLAIIVLLAVTIAATIRFTEYL